MSPFISYLLMIAAAFIALVLVLYYIPFGLWFTAMVSGVRITIFELILMRVRKTPPMVIVQAMIVSHKGGVPVRCDQLEAHFLAGGNVANVVSGLVAANKVGLKLTFERACSADFKGVDLLEAVKAEMARQQVKEELFV